MHFIIGNVTGSVQQRCHHLIRVCRNDAAVSVLLNTDGVSRQICSLTDDAAAAAEITVSTPMCSNITAEEENFHGATQALSRGRGRSTSTENGTPGAGTPDNTWFGHQRVRGHLWVRRSTACPTLSICNNEGESDIWYHSHQTVGHNQSYLFWVRLTFLA